MSTHLEENLQRDLDRIRFLLTRMAGFAVRTLRDCVRALEQSDQQLCSIIIIRDQRIDQMEKEIDRLYLEFLLRHQPAGAHLRFISAAMHINFQLERVGDYGESIARQILKLLGFNWKIAPEMLNDISSASISMLHNAMTAFARQDANLAEVTAQIEEKVDVLRNQVNSELLHLVQSNQMPLAALTPLMTIARRFERVSDQAKSICQETIYLCTGEYAKHQGSQVYRVLFVDDDHGCRSRIAEAIGRGLHHSEFEFSSAGVEPEPLPDTVLSSLCAHGWAVAEGPVRRMPPTPELHQFQIVIALSERVSRQLPPASRKSLHLEWLLEDPATANGTRQLDDTVYQRVYSELSNRISKLVSALLAVEPTEAQQTSP